jgi:hypothetical protein
VEQHLRITAKLASQKKAMQCLHNALIRTHHITSRKKVAKLKQAATFHDVFVLLRSGGPPGVMYVEGQKEGVEHWVSDVQVSRRCRRNIECEEWRD